MIHICIINHNHDELITKKSMLSDLSERYNIVIKSNTPATESLKRYCCDSNIVLLDKSYGYGFSKNNNYVFNYLNSKNLISTNDHFIVMNPDVEIESDSIEKLVTLFNKNNTDIGTINLFRDKEYSLYDNSIKQFPSVLTPWLALVKTSRNDTYDKKAINKPCEIDWAAGSFLIFKAAIFEKLGGFDEDFFMYFEDVDICKRAAEEGYKITYFPSIRAIHYAAFANRNIFSKAFKWYLTSYSRYHIKCFNRQLEKRIKKIFR
ncbi:glycosyltransferase family 2 protein [Photobacterium marinum]|uniref:glycosyltransferase family 2 protein n=1 Tax=Photobacterium marinum TaxID=1056511 RepID=UPI0006872B1C|nr:glycosyltransferase family 2 protein [Photobacterium marinum]